MKCNNSKIIDVFITKIKEIPNDATLIKINSLPVGMLTKSNRYMRWQDKMSYLAGRVLLNEALIFNGFEDFSLDEIKFSKYGRPFFDHFFDFNISHSGEYVVCALGLDNKIGIDIEQHKNVELNFMKSILTKQEFNSVTRFKNTLKVQEKFYELWTKKESVMKADGRGLSIPIKEVFFEDNSSIINLREKKWFLEKIKICNDYSAYIANSFEEIIIRKNYFDF